MKPLLLTQALGADHQGLALSRQLLPDNEGHTCEFSVMYSVMLGVPLSHEVAVCPIALLISILITVELSLIQTLFTK